VREHAGRNTSSEKSGIVDADIDAVYLYSVRVFVNTLYRNKYEVAVNSTQARAARAILKLGVREVAELAKVTANTVSRVEQDEAGPRGPQPVTVEAIKRVYEARGIVFFDEGPAPHGGPGVRLAKS
jgi:hypothetical protein